MKLLLVIARKEFLQAIRNKGVMVAAFIFAIWFPVFTTLGVLTGISGDPGTALGGHLANLSVVLAIFMGYLFSSDAFFREKKDGTIMTFLCAPVSLRQIWEGKVIGVSMAAYGMTILSVLITVAVAILLSPVGITLPLLLLVHVFVILPIYAAASAGVIGAAQLYLGMRENQFLGMGFIFLFIFMVFGLQVLISPEGGITILTEVFFGLMGIVLLLVGRRWAGRLSKERIVRTIA
ncbi:ABC-2 type transport system permease protein [Methanocalculus alkaliphilus]|uniref:ABC transporter permease n=1 Tax=Methanocalculus alkaliphilus TaxID=768730 RepID=UPI0020A225C0|nr:ABC transporter permease [Methanocalculus alkaliphilus]MCP1715642.1 ABC-2 type transport system permease protein [Methanocalculus alkaliphilus]